MMETLWDVRNLLAGQTPKERDGSEESEEAGSREQGAGSRKQGAGSREQGAGSEQTEEDTGEAVSPHC